MIMHRIKAKFIKEQKTRFLCDIMVDGKQEECYVPSSCKLSKLYDMSGREVLVCAQSKSNTRTKYSLFAIRNKSSWILLNLSYANHVIHRDITRRMFSFLGTRKSIFKERTVADYKADIYIADQNCIIEVKTLLSNESSATFPSVKSKRAIAQLEKLSNLLDRGYKVLYIITSLNPYVKHISLNKKDELYCSLFKECISKGMDCKAVSLRIIKKEPTVYSFLKIII